MGDGRKAQIFFSKSGDATKIVESFEPESENPRELQQGGWQAAVKSTAGRSASRNDIEESKDIREHDSRESSARGREVDAKDAGS